MVLKQEEGGFNFSNFERNKRLKTNLKYKYKKTGTTIVGTIFKDGVVLGADTRASEGRICSRFRLYENSLVRTKYI